MFTTILFSQFQKSPIQALAKLSAFVVGVSLFASGCAPQANNTATTTTPTTAASPTTATKTDSPAPSAIRVWQRFV